MRINWANYVQVNAPITPDAPIKIYWFLNQVKMILRNKLTGKVWILREHLDVNCMINFFFVLLERSTVFVTLWTMRLLRHA